MTPEGYIGYVFCVSYVVNIICTLTITSLFLIRIHLFFGNSKFFVGMLLLGIVVFLSKSFGDVIGFIVSYRFAVGQLLTPLADPLYSKIALVMAFATSLECIFSAVGSFSFIYYVSLLI